MLQTRFLRYLSTRGEIIYHCMLPTVHVFVNKQEMIAVFYLVSIVVDLNGNETNPELTKPPPITTYNSHELDNIKNSFLCG